MGLLLLKQIEFALMVPRLIDKVPELGFGVTLGDAFRDKRCAYGLPGSFHKKRLVIDLNLFIGEKYLPDTLSHKPLGEWWESQGGIWGGRFGESRPGAGDGWDGNHYQWPNN